MSPPLEGLKNEGLQDQKKGPETSGPCDGDQKDTRQIRAAEDANNQDSPGSTSQAGGY